MRGRVCPKVGRRRLRPDSVPEQRALVRHAEDGADPGRSVVVIDSLLVEHFVWRRDALPDSLTSADPTRSPSLSRPIARRGRGVAPQGRQAVGVDMPTIPAGPARAPRGRSARRTGRVPQLPGSRNPCSRGTYDRSGPAGCVEDLEKSGSGGPENDGRIRRIARDIERVEHRLAASPRRVAGPRSALSPLVAGITAGSATVAPRARWLS